MKLKSIYYLLLIISILGIIIPPYGIVNTMLSLKYETRDIEDCISSASGENLCDVIRNFKILFVICLITFVSLIYFRKTILNRN